MSLFLDQRSLRVLPHVLLVACHLRIAGIVCRTVLPIYPLCYQHRLDSRVSKHDTRRKQAVYTGHNDLGCLSHQHSASFMWGGELLPMRFFVETSAVIMGGPSGICFGGTRSAIGLKLILRRSVAVGDRARGCRSIDSMESTRWSDMVATGTGGTRAYIARSNSRGEEHNS